MNKVFLLVAIALLVALAIGVLVVAWTMGGPRPTSLIEIPVAQQPLSAGPSGAVAP